MARENMRYTLLLSVFYFLLGCEVLSNEGPPPRTTPTNCTGYASRKTILTITKIETGVTVVKRDGKPLETIGGSLAGGIILGGAVGAGVGALIGHESTEETTKNVRPCAFRIIIDGTLLSYYGDDPTSDDYRKCTALKTGDKVEVITLEPCWRDTGHHALEYKWKLGVVTGTLL